MRNKQNDNIAGPAIDLAIAPAIWQLQQITKRNELKICFKSKFPAKKYVDRPQRASYLRI